MAVKHGTSQRPAVNLCPAARESLVSEHTCGLRSAACLFAPFNFYVWLYSLLPSLSFSGFKYTPKPAPCRAGTARLPPAVLPMRARRLGQVSSKRYVHYSGICRWPSHQCQNVAGRRFNLSCRCMIPAEVRQVSMNMHRSRPYPARSIHQRVRRRRRCQLPASHYRDQKHHNCHYYRSHWCYGKL